MRLALHTGDVEAGEGNEPGRVLREARRILLAAHAGQVLCSEVTAVLLRGEAAAGVAFVELGAYRLGESAAPLRLFQLGFPGLPPHRFPPLLATPVSPASLPVQLTRFVGREAELTRLTALLAPLAPSAEGGEHGAERGPDALPHAPGSLRAAARLVTLTGPGGSGKTRLAIEAARRLQAAFRDAVWFVPLAHLRDAALIPGTILDALRLPRVPGIQPLEQIAAALRPGCGLLVLDNFEQLAGEAAATGAGPAVIAALLRELPELRCLVTSRRPLGLAGEREFPLVPLPTPRVAALLEAVAASESVQLFVDRAQAVRPDFQVTRANATALAELCARLEGLPLALELAAARIRSLTPGEMLPALERRLDFLVSRRGDLPERHRSLRAAVEWSYQLLRAELQRFFAHLSIFRGGFTLEAAAAIADGAGGGAAGAHEVGGGPGPRGEAGGGSTIPTLAALEQLREGSLVLAEETAAGTRFRMLETLREFAAEQLSPEERAALRERHGQYYLELAESAAPTLSGPGQRDRLQRLEADHDNFRAALEFSAASGWLAVEHRPETAAGGRRPATGHELALRLCAALSRFWHVRGHFDEGRRWLRRALAADPGPPSLARAWALRHAGLLAHVQGDNEEAHARCEESLALFRLLGDARGVAGCLTEQGHIAKDRGQHATAAALLTDALAAWHALNDSHAAANCLLRLGEVALHQGDLERAAPLVAESLAFYRKHGDRLDEAVAISSEGDLTYTRHDYQLAECRYQKSLALHQEVDSQRDIPILMACLGLTALRRQERERGKALVREGYSQLLALGDHPGVTNLIASLCGVVYDQGDAERAARLAGLAGARCEAMGCPFTGSLTGTPPPVAAIRAALGEERFAAAWQAGRALSPEEALHLALAE